MEDLAILRREDTAWQKRESATFTLWSGKKKAATAFASRPGPGPNCGGPPPLNRTRILEPTTKSRKPKHNDFVALLLARSLVINDRRRRCVSCRDFSFYNEEITGRQALWINRRKSPSLSIRVWTHSRRLISDKSLNYETKTWLFYLRRKSFIIFHVDFRPALWHEKLSIISIAQK